MSATEEAKLWEGWGTGLAPSWEPILVCQKPLDGTYVNNALVHGVGGINIGGCRVGDELVTTHSRGENTAFPKRPNEKSVEESGRKARQDFIDMTHRVGRWPKNTIIDEEMAEMLDEQSGVLTSGNMKAGTRRKNRGGYTGPMPETTEKEIIGDSGGASRFFYCSKASREERGKYNKHPTVKPLSLLKWLVILISSPKKSVLLDPFVGSGSFLLAAREMKIRAVGIELDKDTCAVAKRRLEGLIDENPEMDKLRKYDSMLDNL
jgi:hypothetical protein